MKSKSNKLPACTKWYALVLAFTVFVYCPSYAVNVTLGWDPNDEPDLEGYAVYYNVESPGPPYKYAKDFPEEKLSNPLNPMVTLTGLKENTDYYVAVTAYDTDGNESYYSDDVCVQVVDSAAELCGSGDSDGGGGGGSSMSCFISSAGLKTASPGSGSFFPSCLAYILFSFLFMLLLGAAGATSSKFISRLKVKKLIC